MSDGREGNEAEKERKETEEGIDPSLRDRSDSCTNDKVLGLRLYTVVDRITVRNGRQHDRRGAGQYTDSDDYPRDSVLPQRNSYTKVGSSGGLLLLDTPLLYLITRPTDA